MTEWREGTAEGSFRTIVRNPGEEVGNTDTKGVMELCHMIMVPPWALALSRGRSGSWKSSEFKKAS